MQGDGLLLDRKRQRLRIPLEAIERVGTSDDGRTLEIVLTSRGPGPGTVHRCESRNRAGVTAFADTVNDALPPRGRSALRNDGDALVTVRQVKGGDLRDWALMALIAGGVLLLVVGGPVLVYREGPLGEAGAVYWFLGCVPLSLAWVSCTLVGQLWVRCRLWNRGVTISGARLDGRTRETARYAFTDLRGERRTVRPGYDLHKRGKRFPETMSVVYDPDHPDRAATVLPGWRLLAKAVAILFVGLPSAFLVGYVYPYQVIAALFL
ncbi:hypothetical protein JNUCC64_05580 [Streptomyces sp. JNUCC 64]